MVRTDPTADASLAAIRERSRFGIAIAAIIRMIATTISNSINEKPFCFLFIFSPRSLGSESHFVLPAGVLPDKMQGCDQVIRWCLLFRIVSHTSDYKAYISFRGQRRKT